MTMHLKKILIIDDEVDLCILMKNYLAKKNYHVHYAHTLKDGMQLMEEVVPDILFLDNNLPDGIGWTKASFFLDINPSLQLYLMSGYQPTLPELPDDKINVLHKPLSLSDLDAVTPRK
jgi:DNA-binding NtrC family response regulator